jgi:hypothetical protein
MRQASHQPPSPADNAINQSSGNPRADPFTARSPFISAAKYALRL